jgi:long-chain acyl-CoA synthetase
MTSTIGQILPVAAQRFGSRTALVVGERSFSFDELEDLSSRVANGLVEAGVQPGDRVALFGPNCWEWLVAYYGIAKTGAVVIPVNVMLTPDEVRYVVEDSGTRAVVASADKGEPLLDLRGTGKLQDVVLWGEKTPSGANRLADWLLLGRPGFRPVERDGGDLAAICYTSGTTGRPKGAMQPHRAVIGAAVGTAVMAARGPGDRVINSLPLPHVYGSCVFNSAMMAGSTLIMIPRFDAETVLRAIGEHRATLMDGVPTAYYYLLAHPDFRVPRPLEPDVLLGGRPDAAGGQGAGVHRALRLPDPRDLGHDRARRRHQRQPGDRTQQARHDRYPLSGQRDARRRPQ